MRWLRVGQIRGTAVRADNRIPFHCFMAAQAFSFDRSSAKGAKRQDIMGRFLAMRARLQIAFRAGSKVNGKDQKKGKKRPDQPRGKKSNSTKEDPH
jgi:hypothetical protein